MIIKPFEEEIAEAVMKRVNARRLPGQPRLRAVTVTNSNDAVSAEYTYSTPNIPGELRSMYVPKQTLFSEAKMAGRADVTAFLVQWLRRTPTVALNSLDAGAMAWARAKR